MKTTEAKTLARNLMDQHGLEHVEFKFNRSMRALGMCKSRRTLDGYVPVRIELSEKWVPHLSDAEVKDTILHEIAHALAGHEAAHGPEWKAAARKVGANPKRTAEEIPLDVQKRVLRINAKYVASCKGCDNEVYFNRLGKTWQRRGYRCSKCRSQFNVIQLR